MKFSDHEICIEEEVLIAENVAINNNIILYNDDVNTFDFVIETLKEVCGHEQIQAEQCTWLVHLKGKCAVKTGSLNKLRPIKDALIDRGLTASIE
jgi:ATP-dependent Clp protease adaptor protein ClpS